MVKVIVEPQAKLDIKSIYQYIKLRLKSPQGATNFLTRTMEDIGRLADFPTLGMIDEEFLPHEYRYVLSHLVVTVSTVGLQPENNSTANRL